MDFRKIAIIGFAFLSFSWRSSGSTISFSGYTLLGSFESSGLIDLNSIGTWNGSAITDTNRPSDFERELHTTVNFYGLPSQPNSLFMQVTGVTTTHFGFAFGGAFTNLTLTGIRFDLPVTGGGDLNLPLLSLDYANPNQALVYAPPDRATEALDTTPGFAIADTGLSNRFLINTVSGPDYGFINDHWTVFGSGRRIVRGGVFQLTMDVDIFSEIDFQNAMVESQYGMGNQYVPAQFVGRDDPPASVPEGTGNFVLMVFGISGLFAARRIVFRR